MDNKLEKDIYTYTEKQEWRGGERLDLFWKWNLTFSVK